MKPKIAIVRGKFLNRYEMQFFEPLVDRYDITAFGSLTPYHDKFAFPVVKLLSPMDLPEFPYKMAVLNRICTDAHYLLGLEEKLRGFDLIHTAETYFHCTQQCLNAKANAKVIATVLENIPFNNEGIRGRKVFKKRARKELDHIIALTQKTKDALVVEGADPKKISIISHYVDTKRFIPGSYKKSVRTILFCGRLEEEKGIFDFVEMAMRLPKSLRFVMVGEGSQKDKLRRFPVELLSISYDDMPAIYHQADIFVAPSRPTATWEEQYSTVLLEAQACGLPIVTTKTGGIPENVGDAAIVVSPGDIDALVTAVKRFIKDTEFRKIYAKKARSRALAVHDIKIGAQKLDNLYRSLLP